MHPLVTLLIHLPRLCIEPAKYMLAYLPLPIVIILSYQLIPYLA